MKPKEFIQVVFLTQIKNVVEQHPYLSFLLIAAGIEYLGKCLTVNKQSWHWSNTGDAFEKGATLLAEVNPNYDRAFLKDELRNGFAHAFIPKTKIELVERKDGFKNFQKSKSGKTIIVAEDLYEDFAAACKKVLLKEFPTNDKMNKEFLSTDIPAVDD